MQCRRLPATVLIHGASGCGKQSLALWLARATLCSATSGTPIPCDACQSCTSAIQLRHPDIHWYFPLPRPKGASSPAKLADALEDARHEKLAEYRSQPLRKGAGDEEIKGIYLAAVLNIRRHARKRPVVGDRQFFVIGDAEHMVPREEASPEAANALLKLLEEPPEGSFFVLTSSRPGVLPDTIRSRALPVHLPPLPVREVATFLQEACGADEKAANDAAHLAQGSIGKALGYLDAESAQYQQHQRAVALLKAATAGGWARLYKEATAYGAGGARELVGLLGTLQLCIRDLAAVSLGQEERVVNTGELPYLRDSVRRLGLSPGRAAAAVEHVEAARKRALGNVNPQLLVSGLLLELEETLADRRSS